MSSGLDNMLIRYYWNRSGSILVFQVWGRPTKVREPVVNDISDVTTLALLNLIRLLAAELVAGEHRDVLRS